MDGQPEARQRASDGDFWTVSGGGVYDGRMNGKPDNSQQEQVTRTASGQLRPGSRLNPHGRPPGSGGGIQRTIESLFDFMNDPAVQARIRDALRKEAEERPYRYARQFILPLTPHKFRRELRARIRAAEQAAFDKAQSPFSGVSKTGQP